VILSVVIVLCGFFGYAKSKVKDVLPPYVLRAHTVAIMIDPEAGIATDDPNANQTARRDVEAALLKWSRLDPVLVDRPADLIIVIRRGHHKLVSQTIPDPRQNSRVGGVNSTDDSIQIGGRRGTLPSQAPGSAGPGLPQSSTHPRTEIGAQEDSFAVYDGSVSNPLDTTPAWRYMARDALRSPAVPAVDEFRKAVAAAEKAAATKP
jgi:hypothetical protein